MTSFELQGMRVLVTGASSGVGLAIVRKLADAGAVIGFHYRRPDEEVEEIVRELRASNSSVVPVRADLTVDQERDAIIERFVEVAGGIDALVNNAGAVRDYRHFSSLPIESWEETLSVNATAPFVLCRDAWPYFERAGAGRIVNISSAAVGYGGGPNGVHYVAAKAALEGMTKALSKAGAGQNILVNAVRCGVIDTPMHEKVEGYEPDRFAERIAMIPVGRIGRPDEVAELVMFLVSPSGSFISGETISISGGD